MEKTADCLQKQWAGPENKLKFYIKNKERDLSDVLFVECWNPTPKLINKFNIINMGTSICGYCCGNCITKNSQADGFLE